jgi:hypothetical protein
LRFGFRDKRLNQKSQLFWTAKKIYKYSSFGLIMTPLSSVCYSFSKTMASSSQATVDQDNKEISKATNRADPADQTKNIKGNDNANVSGQKVCMLSQPPVLG